jgi:glutathione synthase
MRIGVIMDPIESLGLDADTTFAWMLAAQRRGHELFYIKPDGLEARGGVAHFEGAPVQIRAQVGDHYTLGQSVDLPMGELDLCWMRKDPPFDDEYLFSTYILELADRSGACWVVNRPRGLRDANEKAYILNFPDLIPRTLVTHHSEKIKTFVDAVGGKAVIKPLDGHGGSEVFLLTLDDPNLNTILEVITRLGRRYVMVQQYVPEARAGDKRILLVDGEPLGAVLRVPQGTDLRGNLHVGGRASPGVITARDREIIETISPRLREDGIYFAGIDILGDFLTEVNVTSPTGIQEMSRFDGVDYSDQWIAWQEGALERRSKR